MHVSKPWQKQLAEGIADPAALLAALAIDKAYLEDIGQFPFKLRVPRCFVNRMKRGDIADPLLRQVLPLKEESVSISGFSQDPLQEKQHNPLPGLIHKYQSRVLLMPTSACAIHCRYCFRRYFPYEENTVSAAIDEKILDYIRQHPLVDEVILSGGDPLVMNDKGLQQWLKQLDALPQLNCVRIHSRLPVVLPDRITSELCDMLFAARLKVVMVIHCNHPQEIDETVEHAFQKLIQSKVVILNQSVLLKGVNDDADVLAELSKKLFRVNVLPYYLHLLDKVSGVHHFEVSAEKAKLIWQALLVKLPGYLVPRLVRETPGAYSKIWI